MTRLRIEAVATGGEGIGRDDGKAVFVPGAVPGDLVDVEVVADKPRYARARIVAMVQPSPHRIPMPCPHASECGGCSWQMVERSVQARWKEVAVVSALQRIGGFTDVTVHPIRTPGPDYGYRNRIDLHPSDRGPGFHRAGTHDVVPIQVCLLAASPVAALLDSVIGRSVSDPLTIRAGLATGEAVVIGAGHARPGEAVITEIVAGVRFQISGRAFFQPNTAGADTLVELVDLAAGQATGTFVDTYAGVGLFSGTVGRRFERIVAIESNRVAAADLARNVPAAEVVARPAASGLSATDRQPDVLVVDPPRTGLDGGALEAVLRVSPRTLVSVSCDPATFARDARRLVDDGYDLEWVQPVDQFPQTPHVETVARFVRS